MWMDLCLGPDHGSVYYYSVRDLRETVTSICSRSRWRILEGEIDTALRNRID